MYRAVKPLAKIFIAGGDMETVKDREVDLDSSEDDKRVEGGSCTGYQTHRYQHGFPAELWQT